MWLRTWSNAVFWPESGEQMAQKAIQESGRIDGLVNKAV
jgi:NAD(P)-dependent dehydrogenase (short-subunit alcohol dehydrogenase family)